MSWLARPRVLWCSFIATVAIGLAFQVIVGLFDLVLLDAIPHPGQVRASIAGMSESQRTLHAWMTATLDVAFPVAYAALFIGAAFRFFPRAAPILAIPTLILVPVDLMEGVVQVLGLTDTADWIDTKAFLTPLKSLLFVTGSLVTILGWARWAVARTLGKSDQPNR